MVEFTIYGNVQASRTWWTAWMCEELSIGFSNDPIDYIGERIQSEQYRAINPNMLIPCLKEGDFILWESMAINLYLAKKYRSPVSPTDLESEAHMSQWSFWAVTRIEIPLLTLRIGGRGYTVDDEKAQYFLKHIPMWDEEELERCRRVLHAAFRVPESLLARQPYLLGANFSAADLNVSCIFSRLTRDAIDMT